MAERTEAQTLAFERARSEALRRNTTTTGQAAQDVLAKTGLPELPPLTGYALFDRILYGLQGKVYNPTQEGPK